MDHAGRGAPRGLGTGRNFADYDQATLKVGLLTAQGVLLEPELTLLRQGEGNPRLAHPLPPAYPSTPTLFEGVMERTWRVALGATRTLWVGSLGVSYGFTKEGRLGPQLP